MTGVIESRSWTGRAPYAGTPLQAFRTRLRNMLYPPFNCEQCVGQQAWQGCDCAYHLGVAPGVGPGSIRHWLRGFAERRLGVTP